MRQRLQGMVFGFVLAALVMGGSFAVFATTRTETLTVTFRDIRLMVNNELVIPTDVRGNVVEPFMISGTTYLPIRAVSEALGMEVYWDSALSTVYINDPNIPFLSSNRPAATFPDYLVGIWRYDFGDYDVFNADGTGMVLGDPVLWGVVNGAFLICFTPELCRTIDDCAKPEAWHYERIGNRIYLTDWYNPNFVEYFTMVEYKSTLAAEPGTLVPLPRPEPVFPEELIGVWLFEENIYTILNADGTGRDGFINITWGVFDNILLLCFTPHVCESICTCPEPEELYFVIEGDYLFLISPWYPDFYNTLVRVDYMPEERSFAPIADVDLSNSPLLGTWYWMGTPWYVFHADGTGTSAGDDIIWSATEGILSFCTTPHACGHLSNCWFPSQWFYEIVGDQLRLTNWISETTYFYYTRG